MPKPIDQFTPVSADWRRSIRSNNLRTIIIIGMFFFIYLGLGLLVDAYNYAERHRAVPLSQIFYELMTLQLPPIATLVMIFIAIFSLFVTFRWYDQVMLLGTKHREITSTTASTPAEQQLYNIIEELKIASGLRYMPKVFIIEADYMNAFASGYSEKSAMVAITRGLLEKLNRDEIQAVMAHELSHIRHLDIKLTLMASVLANFMIIALDIFFYRAVYSNRSQSNSGGRNSLALFIVVLRYVLPIINILLLLYLSRTREYMADAGCVELLRDNKPLASALLKINEDTVAHRETYSAAYNETPHEGVRREAYIFNPTQAGIRSVSSLTDLFSTHPNLKDRLAALGFKYDK